MTRITADFGIVGPVEFLDVHVDRDNLLFLDPSAIRKAAHAGDVYGLAADKSLTDFFDGTLKALRSSRAPDRAKGEADLQHFTELGVTRLGMSRTGYDGHGAAEELGTRIWEELSRNPLCLHAIARLKYIEDVPLFVDGIDKDVTSDITARIVLETLEQFTGDMIAAHPEFSSVRPLAWYETRYWDVYTASWEKKTLLLPVADDKPLLLVPKWLVNYKIQMTFGQYYGVPLLEYIKWEDTVEVTRGKRTIVKPRYSKKQLRTMPSFAPSRKTNTQQTARIFEEKGVDILGQYRARQQTAFEPLSDDALDYYLSKEP